MERGKVFSQHKDAEKRDGPVEDIRDMMMDHQVCICMLYVIAPLMFAPDPQKDICEKS